MKTTINLIIILAFLVSFSSCNHNKKEDPVPVNNTPEYQKAIIAKYKAIGWDKDGHAKFNNSDPVKTASGKGWVQYYSFGDKKAAIYYSEKGAFAMNTSEMNKYEAIGQDNIAIVVSDPKLCGAGCGYNDIINADDGGEGIILLDFAVRDNIYKKYKELNRWDGPLGIPTNNLSDLNGPVPCKWQAFSKNNGQIYISGGTTNGPQAFWGKIATLYSKSGFDGGWLGLPIESCDPKKVDNGQSVLFKYGRISIANDGCGNYYGSSGSLRNQDGSFKANSSPNCY